MMMLAFLCFQVTCAWSQKTDTSFHSYWYNNRLAYFQQLPEQEKPVIFFGDSITEWADWNELTGYGNVLNRGISGDITPGLLHRLPEVVRHNPVAVFILIGTNDLNKNIPLQHTAAVYKKLLAAMKAKLPAANIYVQTVMPINDSLINRQYYKATNRQIQELNLALEKVTGEEGVELVDLHAAMRDGRGQLKAAYTYDGLHLNGRGYLRWVECLREKHLLNCKPFCNNC